jgi:hypothetical protein
MQEYIKTIIKWIDEKTLNGGDVNINTRELVRVYL